MGSKNYFKVLYL